MFTVKIATGNDAFSDDARAEVARMLRELAERLENGSETGAGLYDSNGNKVGRFTLTN